MELATESHKKRNKALVFLRFLKDRFNLETDKADEQETIEYMKRSVEFKGPNLWILIFAMFIASIGLNVNSTAVIIGAMLISPLMSPILGIGMSVAINDLDFLKKSAKNLWVATLFSVAASTLYFSITPLDEAQSELLARTNPTIWDVLIAFFGGMAGIVAGSRKEKSNAIPGVAIATALMPPLCTAGYGIATGNLYFFLGATYLFFINGIFISLATFLIVRMLGYPMTEFADKARQQKVRSWITFFVVITILPSIYLAYRTVERSVFERNALKFIQGEMAFPNTRVISRELVFDLKSPSIEVSLFGDPVSPEEIESLKAAMPRYGLKNTSLEVFQGTDQNIRSTDATNMLRAGILEELYKHSEEVMRSKDSRILFLEGEILRMKTRELLSREVAAEARALYPGLKGFSLDRTLYYSMDSLKQDTTYVALVTFKSQPPKSELTKMKEWLQTRVKDKNVMVVVNR